MTTPEPSPLRSAMELLGWSYDAATNGYRRGSGGNSLWITTEQAQAAFDAAKEARAMKATETEPRSETLAKKLVDWGL